MASSSFQSSDRVNLIITGPPKTGKKSFIHNLSGCREVISKSKEDIFEVYNSTFKSRKKSAIVTVWYVQNLRNSVERIKEICCRAFEYGLILFFYAIDDPFSLISLTNDHVTVLREQGRFHFVSLLVGNKVDMRDGLRSCVAKHQGDDVKTSFCLSDFIECTAMNQQMVKDVYRKAVLVALGME